MSSSAPGFRMSLRALALGTGRRQQHATSHALLVLAVYVGSALLLELGVRIGLYGRPVALIVSAWNVGGGLVFYVLLRTGALRRFVAEPALVVPQMLWAMASISVAYANVGAGRGVPLLLMALLLPFGSFVLGAAALYRMAAVAFAMLASVMLWRSITLPAVYEPRVELVHAVGIAAVLAVLAAVSIRLGRLHRELLAQRAELTKAVERIQALATRDELTGLLNRRAILERMHGELRERGAERPRMTVAMIDIDRFKHVNDSFGHAAGDEVLRRFAELARQEIRTGDVLARWGGEEFLLMLPGAGLQQALASLQRMRERLRATPMDDVAAGLVISFSGGVAVCNSEQDLEPAIERADAAMYRAKQAGRDRVVCAEVG